MQFSIPYALKGHQPLVGEPTARANFCEEDFIVTGAIAEFVNTLTNLAYVIYAVHRLRRSPTKNASVLVQLPYYGLALVGVSSALFHGTLKFSAQMCDDISMLVASACVLQRAAAFDHSPKQAKRITALLAATLLPAIGYHIASDEKTVHELAFVLLILLVALRTRSLIRTRSLSVDQHREYRDKTIMGAASFALVYTFWQLDFRYCSTLTNYKRHLGMPWSFVLEFHGLWHILTAVGAYTFMTMVEQLTQDGPASRRRRKLHKSTQTHMLYIHASDK